MPTAFLYTLPTGDPDGARALAETYHAQHLPGYTWDRSFQDTRTAAAKPFRRRPQGLKLTATAQSGDALLTTAGAFCGINDLLATIRILSSCGVRVILLDLDVLDTGTAAGRHALAVLGKALALESERHSARIRQALAARRREGRPTGTAPYGHKIKKYRDRSGRLVRELVDNPKERAWGKKMLAWREARWSVFQIYTHLRDLGAINPRTGRPFGVWSITRWSGAELALQRLEARQTAAAGG